MHAGFAARPRHALMFAKWRKILHRLDKKIATISAAVGPCDIKISLFKKEDVQSKGNYARCVCQPSC